MNFTSLSLAPKSLRYAAPGLRQKEPTPRGPNAEGGARRLGFTRLLPRALRRREPLQTLAPVVIHVQAEEDVAPASRPASSQPLYEAVRNLGTQLIMFLPLRDGRVLATVTHGFNDCIARDPHYREKRAAFDRLRPELPGPLTTRAGRANARVEIARERARIQSGREPRQGAVVKFLAQGCDGNFLRLNVLREVDAEITRLSKTSPLDSESLELVGRSRERMIQDALQSMADRSLEGGVTRPARTPSLRARFHSGIVMAQRAREQRHSLLKLVDAESEARRDVDALDRRALQLDLLDAGDRHPMTNAAVTTGEAAALHAMTQMGYGHNLQLQFAECDQLRKSVDSLEDPLDLDVKALEDMLQRLRLPQAQAAKIRMTIHLMDRDGGRALRHALNGLATHIELALRDTLIDGALRV